jgi:hypothetical protein
MIRTFTRRRGPAPTQLGWGLLFLLAVVLGALTGAATARAAGPDPVGALHAAAQHHGVAAEPLIAIARCESSLDPSARGDRGHSHGLMQLSDLPGTGLLWHFKSKGYDNAYSAEQSADYVARVAGGEWRHEGVTLRRWSCYR